MNKPNNNPPPPAIKPTASPTFLTLPRQLRQSILYKTYDPQTDAHPFITFTDGSNNVSFNSYHVDPTGKFIGPLAYMEKWVEVLGCVHPVLRADVGVVRMRWVGDVGRVVVTPRWRSLAFARGEFARVMGTGEVVVWEGACRERGWWGWWGWRAWGCFLVWPVVVG
ncbi:hypothetical protein E6O75_ATG06964 [Venturia nashicola]|uniref:Uncharacterized protein n=1 Tax=Venturia nashicola TaxID=86259 RepID=A0A4Z1P0P9_9PEZI|nr:hypothetical protein E6O75_ATG06964 [Venturia nashicola]